MKKSIIISLIFILMLPFFSEAQRWKRYRRQIVVGAGVTNFLGELGGGNDLGRDGPLDLDFAATRPSILVGYRYQLNSYFFLRGNIQWGILRGDDKFTEEPFRSGRNLHFRSGFFEANFMGEFYMVQNARSNLYNLRGVRGRSGLGLDVYVFGGLGLMYFNPKAEFNGQWFALQPLGTEGQGLQGQDKKYSRITFTLPYGIGIGKTLDRYWAFNVEFTMRQTFTDYLDDVSTTYYGRTNLYNAKIAAGSSDAEARRIAILSDPSTNLGGNDGQSRELNISGESGVLRNDLVGQQRGDPSDKDSFMTLMFTVSRKIVKRRRSRSKF